MVNASSGGNDYFMDDFVSMHRYPGPAMPALEPHRAVALGQFGAFSVDLKSHTWNPKSNGHTDFNTVMEMEDKYQQTLFALRPLITNGLAAAVYTQLTDVEDQLSGLITYDRAVVKVNIARAQAAHRALIEPPSKSRVFVPDVRRGGATWRYTTTNPGPEWVKPEFDQSKWEMGNGTFGNKPKSAINPSTVWNTPEIWLRLQFEYSPALNSRLVLSVFHDNEAEIYINGQLAAIAPGAMAGYHDLPISVAAQAALRQGSNTISVHAMDTGVLQVIDVGIVEYTTP